MTTIRDPLWNNIRVDSVARELLDTPVFQRLRYVRQLGWAFLVYPGATHSRFEHALGAHHLARRSLELLDRGGHLSSVRPDDCDVVRAAALLHDVGHYPFSHALEEIGASHHEEVARSLVTEGEVAGVLRAAYGDDAPRRVHDLIRGASASPLQRLISGSLDLDKIDYLKRDAMMCGVPYGEVDVDRLLDALVVVEDVHSGAPTVAVLEKGLAALESLLFAKYQMYRNVYWHHAVRSATAMYKRLVNDALAEGALRGRPLATFTDEGLLLALEREGSERVRSKLEHLRGRRLYKRILEFPAAELDETSFEWIATDRRKALQVEDDLAGRLGLRPGELVLDFPTKEGMLGVDLPIVRRGGEVEQLTSEGLARAINLPKLSEQLYRSARWLRIFAAERREVDAGELLTELTRSR